MRRFGLLAALFVALLIPAEARSGDDAWRGSVRLAVKLNRGRPRERKGSCIIADATTAPGATSVDILVPGYSALSAGAAKSRRFRVASSANALAWAQHAIKAMTGQDLQLSTVSGGGRSTAKGIGLGLRVAGTAADGVRMHGSVGLRNAPYKQPKTITGTVGSAGGLIGAPQQGQISVDASFFSRSADVRLDVSRYPLSAPRNSTPVGPTLVAQFPGEAVAVSSTALAGEPSMVLSHPTTGFIAKALPITDDLLTRLVVTIKNAAGNLLSSNTYYTRDAAPRIPQSLLGNAASSSGSMVTLETSVVSSKNFFVSDPEVGLYRLYEDRQAFIQEFNSSPPPSVDANTEVVVLLHGWQTWSDSDTNVPHIDTWYPFLNWAIGVGGGNPSWSANRAAFEFFSIRYPYENRVYDNAVLVQKLLAQKFPGRKITILAYSMGGLIAEAMVKKFHPDFGTQNSPYAPWSQGGIRKIVTLGTPFHGSPIVQAAEGAAMCSTQNLLWDKGLLFILAKTQGTRDLRWDNADGATFSDPNWELSAMNAKPLPSDTEYYSFAGQMSLGNPNHYYYYPPAERLLEDCGAKYAGDGVVPVSSATFIDFGTGQPRTQPVSMAAYSSDFDHTQIWEGRFGGSPDAAHFENILAQLRPTASPPPPPVPPVSTSPTDPGPVSGQLLYEPFQGTQLPTTWQTSGGVYLANGALWTTYDAGGSFGITRTPVLYPDATMKVVVERSVYLHNAQHAARPSITFEINGAEACGVSYLDDTVGNSGLDPYVGFVGWGDQYFKFHPIADFYSIPRAGVWDAWFTERIEYDGWIGKMTWYINGQLMGTADVSRTFHRDNIQDQLTIRIDSFGVSPGGTHGSSYLRVSQVARD